MTSDVHLHSAERRLDYDTTGFYSLGTVYTVRGLGSMTIAAGSGGLSRADDEDAVTVLLGDGDPYGWRDGPMSSLPTLYGVRATGCAVVRRANIDEVLDESKPSWAWRSFRRADREGFVPLPERTGIRLTRIAARLATDYLNGVEYPEHVKRLRKKLANGRLRVVRTRIRDVESEAKKKQIEILQLKQEEAHLIQDQH